VNRLRLGLQDILYFVQDVGDDVTLLVVRAEVVGQRRMEAGTAASAAGRIRAARVRVRLPTGAEELDADVGTAAAVVA